MISVGLAVVSRISNWSFATWFSVIIVGLLTAILLEQIRFLLKKQHLPGPKLVVPFLGGIVHMVTDAYDFWHTQMALGKLSWNSIIGQYLVMVTDANTTRQIFTDVSDEMPLALHPNAFRLLGRDNMAFLNGPGHKELRANLLPLFTQRALSMYLSIQEKFIRQTLKQWIHLSTSNSKPIEIRTLIYDLNTRTSLSVFIGPYLYTEADVEEFQRNYSTLTQGMFGFPLYFPGTALWTAQKARYTIIDRLTRVAKESKQRMSKPDQEPKCLIDFWMITVLKDLKEYEDRVNQLGKAEAGPAPLHSSDYDIACHTLDFLFASQDASTSSLTFTVHLLCQHPEVLARVRAEQASVRPDRDAPFTADTLTNLKYTWRVMREVLRFRPPATIVPHVTKKKYQLSEDYTAPAGTLLVPSIWNSNRTGFSDPETFDPDRFDPNGRNEQVKYDKQFLTFGCGPHVCMGQRYAMNHIMLFISLLTMETDFVRENTDKMNEIIYLPTIYPADGCPLKSLRVRA